MRRWLPLLLAFSPLPHPVWAQLPEGDVYGYVYVEPYELRKEFAIRLKAFPEWTAGTPLDGVLDRALQERVLGHVRAILADACPLEVDGMPLPLQLDNIRFVQVEPVAGVVPDGRAQIPVREAQVAASYGAPLQGYPNEVSTQWNLFPADPSIRVLLSFVSGGGKTSVYPTKENPKQKWAVLKEKGAGELLPVPHSRVAKPTGTVQVPFFTILFAGLAVVLGIAGRLFRGAAQLMAGIAAIFFLVLSVTAWAIAGLPLRALSPNYEPLAQPEAETLVHALLRNIYTSFDYREESQIYDVLERSVTGNLLEKIYLDVRHGLQLEEQGGPRVKINHIDLRSCQVEPVPGGDGLRADAEWVAVGDVTHWGHIHTRLNKYRAWLTLKPLDASWKVTDIEIVEEGRL